MTETNNNDVARAKLAQYRSSIDNIDAALVHMLAERFRCTQAVGHLKATYDLPPADPAREQQQIARLLSETARLHDCLRELGHTDGTDPALLEEAVRDLHEIRAALLSALGRKP